MNELFPIACGVLIGFACSNTGTPRWRRTAWIVLSVVCGIMATVLAAEFKISWEFVLIDIPLVAGSAAAMAVLRKYFRSPFCFCLNARTPAAADQEIARRRSTDGTGEHQITTTFGHNLLANWGVLRTKVE
jgi:hypothetical protein